MLIFVFYINIRFSLCESKQITKLQNKTLLFIACISLKKLKTTFDFFSKRFRKNLNGYIEACNRCCYLIYIGSLKVSNVKHAYFEKMQQRSHD